MDDVSLWNLLLKGDTKTLETLYRRHYDLLLNYGLKYYSDQELIKDCIQDLFIKLHKSNRLKETLHVRSYLLKSVKNILLDKLSTQKETVNLIDECFHVEIDDPAFEQLFLKNDEDLTMSKQLLEAYDKLPENQKNAIYLRYIKGLSYKEIAETMDINPQSSMNLVSRALTKLRSMITDKQLILILSIYLSNK